MLFYYIILRTLYIVYYVSFFVTCFSCLLCFCVNFVTLCLILSYYLVQCFSVFEFFIIVFGGSLLLDRFFFFC